MTQSIRREMRRLAAVEPVIGHLKAEHRLGRNYLKGRNGDRANAVLAAAGYNFALLLRWLSRLLRALLQALLLPPSSLAYPAQRVEQLRTILYAESLREKARVKRTGAGFYRSRQPAESNETLL